MYEVCDELTRELNAERNGEVGPHPIFIVLSFLRLYLDVVCVCMYVCMYTLDGAP